MMSKIHILVFCLFGVISASVGQLIQLGQCNDVELQQDFDLNQFLGTWYEISRLDNPNQSGECSSFQFTSNNATHSNVNYRMVTNNFLQESSGIATLANGTAKLTLNTNLFQTPTDFWVLMTDYTSFSVNFACEQISSSQRRVYIWVLGRETQFSGPMILPLINTLISNRLNVDPTLLTNIDHNNQTCYVLPVIEKGQPVILPGQCDPNITVVQNFRVPDFLGVWHEIASYESENSVGSCARAQYTLGDGVVNVFNSEVVNQTLSTITGTAVVSSADASAKLTVTLNVGPGTVTQDLWVIATDYNNFAISYACTNLPNNQKRVVSWIVSRTRQMSESIKAEVDRVVDSLIDLNYQYYQETNQTDAACFYYPEPIPNQPVIFGGQCASIDVNAMTNFDAAAYMGLWHTIELYPDEFQGGTCSNAFYTLVNGTVDVFNTQVVNQTLDTIRAVAVPATTDGTAKLLVTFPIAGTNLTITTDYWVLNTDYQNYALVYTCFNVNDYQMRVGTWKLSRTKQLLPASATAINTIINSVTVLNQTYYESVDQSPEGCFYFPQAEPDVPVVFPGQCDNNIAAMPNFNMSQFQGTWYEIEAYPKAEQPGQCINHVFTPLGVTLTLQSSNVYDQALEITSGNVRFASTDGTGRLIITITSGNGTAIEIPYWILSTDYTDYALAYSCVNYGSDFRGVWSWKLSRTKQLSAAANTTINNLISNNVVLDNRYYEAIDQSDRACFYLPNLAPGEAIVIPGQCSATIAGISGFNITAYAGRWRLIESYGNEFQFGACNIDRYNIANGILEITNTQVQNRELITTTGTARISSTDGSGKLQYNFPSRNQSLEITVLDTDYTSFALLYGCVNLNNNKRRVYSWKLSRENTLSQAANNRINQVINNIDVLNNRFYAATNRSAAACFYFPPVDTNSIVLFPGQCDQSIPVVTSFDAARYLGLWHDIESFPEEFQNGTCQNALYTPGNDVDVFNTQVFNQSLLTINGRAVLLPSNDGSAKLNVTFNINGFDVTTNYWVLATDYNSYALVYSCRNINDELMQVMGWKLSRTKALTTAASTAITNVANSLPLPVLDQRYFIQRNQTPEGCFYIPEPQVGVPVVFPGQCDNTIQAIPNFNMSQFQGLWYEIEAYPKEEQPGQCINHQFTLNSTNTYQLNSLNVVNQTLTSTTGQVSFATNDGSGRLTINIVVNGQTITIPYWILATDYNNYALAYSCVNLNNDFRGIWSWKLSRTKQLSAASNTAINNAIQDIVVLDNRYYEAIDQSDNACFHYPALGPTDPVIFPGQCDPSIQAIQNFNAARYLGKWRLIETYFSNFQFGTCNNAEYSLAADGSVIVYNTEVVNQTLTSMTGAAVIASTDGSGKLSVTFPSAPAPVDYYVLDTDYDSYALVYSCVNISSNQRQVWSWKLSRTNSLSANATNAINQVVNRVDVLDARYYQTVNRTTAGCFYFPTTDGRSAVVFPGQCDESIPVVTGFDAARYLGLWHDIESYPGPFQFGTCMNAFYSLGNNVVDVFNTQVVNQTLLSIRGTAVVLPSIDGSAKLNVSFSDEADNVTNYWVLSTDYNSYSLVYSCRNIDDDYKEVYLWKLSRTKALTAAASTQINNVISNYNVMDQRYFVNRDQSPEGCFYFPEPQAAEPVVFPGQCDTNIQAMPNFNMSQFQGLWYEIEAYPKEEQPGQCINHQFTLNSTNTYQLNSLNVVNQTLTSTIGQVSFATNDGSGRLTINIVVNGQTITIPYWILATDYNNYALAYSCVNLNNDFRGVWSWKLSRTKQLSAASNTAINNAIQDIVVLDNRYYEAIDQSDNACFYYPALGPTEPVIFPGQCDPSIQAIQNFNAARYLGKWRLIETYFSNFQFGTCNNAEYSLAADGSVIVYNTEVVNQTLTSMTGAAVIASTDGSGKLSVTFPSAPAPVDYYVLDTDYDSYALVYSCVNISSNQRQVWSWKMSRTNSLSANATNAINQVVNRVDVLDARYYQTVNRTTAGCFYFPTTDGRSAVVFPGQCDESIPVVTGFDAARYLGLWHDIESYPGPFQFGTCMNAFYSLGNNVVDVFNTQVVNQTLLSIRGTAVVLPSIDGSAKLNVSFSDEADNVTNYWVLSTDYNSYSLVYSCRNIDDEYKEVYLWKLSRTKALTPAAATQINNVISNYNVMDQRYFVNRDQSPEGCFYFPEPQAAEPVVFPGQCDTNIQAMPNFNMSQFQGLWYEIEAYPKAEQPGQCINHQFTLSSTNTYQLNSLNVVNQTLTSTTGQVSFATNDGSGRLTINIIVNGQTITIPYWILATDYNNYALAYSCVNLNNDFRGVWSWKLSRTKQLPATSNIAINNAIQDIVVLDNRYYEAIDQSDNACFYYPALGPTEPVIFPGQCDPSIQAIQNFNAARYLGRWRLIETYFSNFQFGTCNNAEYSLAADGSVIVYNTEVVNQTLTSMTGAAVIASTDGSGKLSVTFPNAPAPVDYYVLDTDYDSYALVYSCVNISSNQRQVWSWKMSRTNSLSANATNAINQVVNRVDVLDARYYQTVNRTTAGCFYFPTTDGRSAVVFPGQCDESIPVVTGFDAARYLGLWHDIESYPGPFQFGTCMNAFYSLGNNVVDVFNTQVVNQTLLSIRGTAVVLPSIDGSAKLNVSFSDEADNVTNYWVLSTDYNSYSLVYSCRNIDDEYKEVYLWKLSRTKALTPAAATQINNVISNYNVMDQRYFVNRDQSPEGCFYFPEPQAAEPVVFPGQCDTNIQAMPNFNMSQFQGLWYEIEAYPKAEQPGQCINHQFTLSSTNTYQLNSLNVVNQTLTSTTGQVSFATNDGSGRLTINIIVNGQTITIPYWILATDYNNYALAYSCVNLNNDFRGIWSWKLSRTKQLPATSNTAINNAIQNIVVLDNRYYEPIDQSDSACFHYPALGPTDPVIFPGQCDPSIQAIQNFDAARYLGKWRLIETYFSNFQFGTCNNAEYSLAADGSVIVYNTEVVNQTLTSMTGAAVIASTDGSGKLSVTFPSAPAPVDYYVLDTDYDSYALVYSCVNISSNQRQVWSWKMSRTNSLSANATNAINQVVNRVDVLDARYYQTVNRTAAGCFYFPTPNADTTVIFPGQCDESIPVKQNFNPVAYQGLWHDVESYPTPFQVGTCNRAYYTLTPAGIVDVMNTEVVNQILEVTNGTAVLATTDGSAKLNVTFELVTGTVTASYWVLETDYTSYSLVYSCRNIDNENKAVFSWKLGRQPTLTAAANTTINSIMNSVQVLDQRFFVQRRHSEEDCFYYPDNNGGDVILNGQCVPDAQVPAMTNFNASQFAGTWHEVARFPSTLQNGECAATQYSLSGTNAFSVTQTSVINEQQLTTTAQATVASNGRGVISATISGVPFNNVYILGTDYNEYALAYSCRNLENNRKQIYSWKLSRSRAGLSAAANTTINQLVSNNIDLFEGYYRYTAQDNNACFYYPVFDQPQATIELPGPCDTTIRGISNFNAAAYLGRWFEIARYPQRAQTGQCNRAEYSDMGTAVGVFNSQVVNATLATQSGTAVLASTDNSALLEVTFVVSGQTRRSNYYVLATDYSSYSLVYSCVNLGNGNRQVGSWKLSRNRTLSTLANSVMDTVINQTQGLKEDYYQATSQSDESCFYVPEVNVTQAPLFRGQCEDITGMAGFNMNRYLGWWHEIERYPVDGAAGECISSRYEASGNTIQVVDTSVFNLTAVTVQGTVTVTNDGRLRRTLGNNRVQDIWVLDTDYDSYALLYSCENVNNEYRRVWSAKHSKARSLTTAAQAAMAPTIENNRLLYPQFYQTVNQGDEACFHYPTQTGPQVVLPGQCDNSIPVQTNFEMENFAGTWYEIERYDAVTGRTCIGSRFRYDAASGNITVLEFEVVGGELVTREGSGKASADGSGRLTIDMVNPATNATETTSLLILTTDYEDYALAYTCQNINQFERRVGAWKLSRERRLSSSGSTAINAVVTLRPELHQPYFNQISHNDDCLEPSSSFLVKSSIIVVLMCALLQLLL